MNPHTLSPETELISSILISITLLALGVFYMLREWNQWQRNSGYEQLPPEDRRHYRNQLLRRAVGCSLLVASGFVIFLVQVVLDWKEMPRLFAWLWTAVMVGLLGIIWLAGADIVAIRRFARRHRQRLEADRRDMIARQLEQYQEERQSRRRFPPNIDLERN